MRVSSNQMLNVGVGSMQRHASDAINLDGGGSTTLWITNYKDNGVVNFPTDNKKWDHEGERKVANVVLLKKK